MSCPSPLLTADELTSIASAIEALMTDTCVVEEPAAGGALDAGGDWTPAAPTVIFTGACRIRRPNATAIEEIFGDSRQSAQGSYVADLPRDASGIKVDHRLRITVSNDPDLVDRSFRVAAVVTASTHTRRTLGLEAVDGP